MREIVQLIGSILFALLPLWIIILRARQRRQQRAAARPEQAVQSTDQTANQTAEVAEQFVQTDSIWGAQYFTPHRREATTAEEAEPVATAAAETGSRDAAYSEESDRNNAADSAEAAATPAPPGRPAGTKSAPEPVLRHLRVSELQRAVVLSEVLAPPRALRPL